MHKYLRLLYRYPIIYLKQRLERGKVNNKPKRYIYRVNFRHHEYLNKIEEWRRSEPTWSISGRIDSDYEGLHRKLLSMWRYSKDQGDQWQNSDISLETLSGDCEDFAIALCRVLFERGYQNRVGVVIVPGHAFCCLDDNIMLDNGHFVYKPTKMRYLNIEGFQPLFGFDITQQWSYIVEEVKRW